MTERRTFFTRLASLSAALWAGRNAAAQKPDPHAGHKAPAAAQPAKPPAAQSMAGHTMPTTPAATDPHAAHRMSSSLPVEMPDLPKLPFKMVDGVA